MEDQKKIEKDKAVIRDIWKEISRGGGMGRGLHSKKEWKISLLHGNI